MSRMIVILCIVLAGCQQQVPVPLTDCSPVLRESFTNIMQDFLTKIRKKQSQDEMKLSEVKLSRTVAQLRRVSPGFLQASPQQEQRFERGQFEDVSNLHQIQKMLEALRGFQIELRPLTKFVVEQYQADGYQGVRLEVTKQLLEAEMRELADALS